MSEHDIDCESCEEKRCDEKEVQKRKFIRQLLGTCNFYVWGGSIRFIITITEFYKLVESSNKLTVQISATNSGLDINYAIVDVLPVTILNIPFNQLTKSDGTYPASYKLSLTINELSPKLHKIRDHLILNFSCFAFSL